MTEKNNKTSGYCKLADIYKKHHAKLLVLPIMLFVLSCFLIFNTYKQEGSPIYRDVSLKGGLSAIIEIDEQITINDFKLALEEKFPANSFAVSKLNSEGKEVGYIVDSDFTAEDEKDLLDFSNSLFKTELVSGENFTSNYISSSLSDTFFRQAIIALIFSFFFMSLVIFLYFKKIVPSIGIIFSAFFDITVVVGILNLIKFNLSVAGIGAIIMLIGYSIDTNVLLTNRLVKEPGKNYFEKVLLAVKTGSLMSFTTMVAALSAIFFSNSEVIFEISLIICIGLVVDYIATWIQNTSLLLLWLFKSQEK